MIDNTSRGDGVRRLACGVVLSVHEDACEVLHDGQTRSVGFAPMFPKPRTERVSPGHLVAMATTADGTDTVVWRWYDAVVIVDEPDGVRLWEPAHGEVLAQPRSSYVPGRLGTRAYLSAGLAGADWWVAGPTSTTPSGVDVDLAEVAEFCTDHGLWGSPIGDDA